ncbi:HNH endonuclease [Pseudarthrobacter equi]|uniref:HNH endonuclease n=1 Tax=Pseudarthrobacter equi TaxID=728066 RepID=A0A1H1VWA5_9MICC|nr:HNH endonuclease [Pseudarthrobacter equi]
MGANGHELMPTNNVSLVCSTSDTCKTADQGRVKMMESRHEGFSDANSSAAVPHERLKRDADVGEAAHRPDQAAGPRHSSESDRARFYAKTRRAPSGCLLWTAGVSNQGYGKFVLGGRTMPAHRAAWVLEYGEVLSREEFLLHSVSCNSRLCVEIAHLRVGTHAENMADRKAQGRYNTSRGFNNSRARFNDAEVADMRLLVERGVSYQQVAEIYDCTRPYVYLIATGKARTQPTDGPSPYVLAKRQQEAKAQDRRTRSAEIISIVHPDDEIQGEEWRPTRFEGYWVSSLGRVRGRTMKILKPHITDFGYAVVCCGKNNPRGVHVLVCEAWDGPPPAKGMHAAHRNGNPADNRPDNLRWATPSENIGQDRLRHGTVPRGEGHARAKLSMDIARAIRAQLPGPRGTINRLARQYGVTKTAITNVRDSVTWRE